MSETSVLTLSSCFSGDAGGGAVFLNCLHACVPLYVISNMVGSSSDLCTCFVAQQSRPRRASISRYRRLRSSRRWWSSNMSTPLEEAQSLVKSRYYPLQKQVLSFRERRGAQMKPKLHGFLHPLS